MAANDHAEVVLLDLWASPFGQRVRIALEEKGVEYEYMEQDMINKSTLLIESNPVYKKIPVLIHHGKPVCESLVIVQYIDEVWSHKAPLLPGEPFARAQARFWADFIDKKIYECTTRLWKCKGEALEEAKKDFMEIVKTLEVELGDKTFFNGDTFGFVDVALVPFFGRFNAYEKIANFNIEKECPKIVAWGRRCMHRDSVSKILPDDQKIYEFLLMLRKYLGVE
ncbi:hypothetical protein J5N97_008745 [Dioscorea zingiberensis]|uniref:Glutathione S-transferase n=1 Tax=Dioscorea zingiberensis TaxID=325984 RepID=A0A9D5HKT4_9LILI|nr:hypothetical protein J5N97_008745 [Dioscorea zingiberensis]